MIWTLHWRQRVRASIDCQLTALSSDGIQMLFSVWCSRLCEISWFWWNIQVFQGARYRGFTWVSRNISLALIYDCICVSVHNTWGIWDELMLIRSYSTLITRPLIGQFEPTFLYLILIIFLCKAWLLVEFIFVEFDIVFRDDWNSLGIPCCFTLCVLLLRFIVFAPICGALTVDIIDAFYVFVASPISYRRKNWTIQVHFLTWWRFWWRIIGLHTCPPLIV